MQSGGSSKRTWFRIHSFTGVITGLLLFIVCWSGTIAVFSYELDWLLHPEMRVPAREGPVQWQQSVESIRVDYPGYEILRLYAPPAPGSAMASILLDPENDLTLLVYLDPGTGEVTGATNGYNIQRFFRDFHRRLLFPNPWGVLLVSLFAVTLLVSTVASLMFYKRWWKRFFRFRPASGHTFWSELHKLVGLWSLWFILIMVVTGGWYMFEMSRTHFGDGISTYQAATGRDVAVPATVRTDPEGPPALSIDTLLAEVRRQRPDLRIQAIQPGSDGIFYADGQAGHVLVRDRANQIQLEGRSGAVLYEQAADDLPLYWRFSDTADPLHFGDFAGMWSKVPWFLFGLLLSGLILTGLYLHARRLAASGEKSSRHRWPGTFAALCVSVLVLLASIPWGLATMAFFGVRGEAAAMAPSVAPGVAVFIFGWVAVTVLFIAGWIAVLWKPSLIPLPDKGSRSGRTI